MVGFFVKLEPHERAALYELAKRERRDYRDQAALLIRAQLIALGLLQDTRHTKEVFDGQSQTPATC